MNLVEFRAALRLDLNDPAGAAGAVPAGVSNRVGEISRTPCDALVELPG